MSYLSLKPDRVTVPGQRFALVSIVGPDQPQKTEKCGLKIRGCFATVEEARSHVKEIMDDDPHFDVYVMDMYQWVLFPPDRSAIQDATYQEKYLNELMKGHMENQKRAKTFFEERKSSVMLDGLDKHLDPSERLSKPPEIIFEKADEAGPSQ